MAQLSYFKPFRRTNQRGSYGLDSWTHQSRDENSLSLKVKAESSSMRGYRQGAVAFSEVLAEMSVLISFTDDVARGVVINLRADASPETVMRFNRGVQGSGLHAGMYHQTGKTSLKVPKVGSKRAVWMDLPADIVLTRPDATSDWTIQSVNGKPQPTAKSHGVTTGPVGMGTTRRRRRTGTRPLAAPTASETVRSGETATEPVSTPVVAPAASGGALKVKPKAAKVDPLGLFTFPDPAHYTEVVIERETRDELDLIWAKHQKGHREVVALTGPTGTGKTSLAYGLAARHGVGIMKFDIAGARQFEDWTGMTHLKDKETEFRFSGFLTAIDADGPYAGIPRIILLDEANRAQGTSAMNAAIPVLDGFNSLYIPELGRSVNLDPSVLIVMTLNQGSQYGGTVGLDRAFVDRTTSMYKMDYLDASAEAALVVREAKVDDGIAQRLVQAANLIRAAAKRGELNEGGGLSTRAVLEAGYKVADGFSPRRAAMVSWLMPYPDEGTDSEAQTVRTTIDGVLR